MFNLGSQPPFAAVGPDDRSQPKADMVGLHFGWEAEVRCTCSQRRLKSRKRSFKAIWTNNGCCALHKGQQCAGNDLCKVVRTARGLHWITEKLTAALAPLLPFARILSKLCTTATEASRFEVFGKRSCRAVLKVDLDTSNNSGCLDQPWPDVKLHKLAVLVTNDADARKPEIPLCGRRYQHVSKNVFFCGTPK